MATPHNEGIEGSIAKTVLMPGDPLRAKYIAQKYLEHPVLFNSVRNMLGYTGTYKGCLLYTSFHSGRCWTRGLRSASVVAGRGPRARSNTGTQRRTFRCLTATRAHTLGLSNVQAQGQVNLPLCLPT